MPNRWHPDTSTARSAQFVDGSGNLVAQPTTAGLGSLRRSDDASTAVLLLILPTSDPGVTGALWNNSGTITIS